MSQDALDLVALLGDEEARESGPAFPGGWPYACEVHDQLPANATCTRCGRFVCVSCRTLSPLDHLSYCTACFTEVLVENAPEPSPVAQRAGELAAAHEPGTFEPRRVSDVFTTIRAVLTRPSTFFSTMTLEAGVGAAILFALFCNTIGTIMTLVWAPMLDESTPLMLLQMQQEMGVGNDVFMLGVLIALPFATALEVGLYGAVLHLMLRFLGHNPTGRIRTSMKLVAYALASRLLLAIPVLGVHLAPIASVVLLIFATRYVHRAPLLKTAIAVVVPVLLFGGMGMAALAPPG